MRVGVEGRKEGGDPLGTTTTPTASHYNALNFAVFATLSIVCAWVASWLDGCLVCACGCCDSSSEPFAGVVVRWLIEKFDRIG